MAKLSTHVYVQHKGEVLGFGPKDEVPEEIARLIGAHAFEDGVHPYSGGEAGKPPPKGGPGSGAEAWAQYASEHDVSVADGATRDEIVAALSDAGVAVDPQ